MKAYLIRSQTDGILTSRVFLRPPTDEEMQEVLGRNLVENGHKAGAPVDRFVTYIVVETVGEPEDSDKLPKKIIGRLTDAESREVLSGGPKGTAGEVETVAEGIKFEGVGEVILIEDPRHPRFGQ